jgi:hypothetical protein
MALEEWAGKGDGTKVKRVRRCRDFRVISP